MLRSRSSIQHITTDICELGLRYSRYPSPSRCQDYWQNVSRNITLACGILVVIHPNIQLTKVFYSPEIVSAHVEPSATYALLDDLHDLYASINIHLVLTPFDRQLNTWRNAARLFTRTEFVMMLDVDYERHIPGSY
ncbi:hypothetical protein BDR06DRAFT_953974 [Suillus hirtellus]|nr:hypothetical protein BDR06DRAFT_953974 [Suillus hirtellus]